jgi:DNA-directed RNA polymerase specialized sigma24 family protein
MAMMKRQELGKCVLPMIERLPEGYRKAIMLSEIDGLPSSSR